MASKKDTQRSSLCFSLSFCSCSCITCLSMFAPQALPGRKKKTEKLPISSLSKPKNESKITILYSQPAYLLSGVW